MLPGYIEFTDEEERILDQVWAETYDQLHGAPFPADDDEDDVGGDQDADGEPE